MGTPQIWLLFCFLVPITVSLYRNRRCQWFHFLLPRSAVINRSMLEKSQARRSQLIARQDRTPTHISWTITTWLKDTPILAREKTKSTLPSRNLTSPPINGYESRNASLIYNMDGFMLLLITSLWYVCTCLITKN